MNLRRPLLSGGAIRRVAGASCLVVALTSSSELSAQCPGCEPQYEPWFDLGNRSAEYCFNANVPVDMRSAFTQAVADLNSTDVAYTEGNCGFEVKLDNSISSGGLWCYPGSPCDSNGTAPGGHGIILMRSMSTSDWRSAAGHELMHTTGWGDVNEHCNSLMGYPYGRFGLSTYDQCWYDSLWGGGDGNGGPPPPLRGFNRSVRPQQSASASLQVPEQSRRIRPLPPIHYSRVQSLGQMLRAAELVAVVRIRSLKYEQIGIMLLTHYEAEIVEVIRGSEPRSRTLDVYQPGGVVSTSEGTIDYRDPNFRRLTREGYAVLALNWNSEYQGYFTSYGANGVFEVLAEAGSPLATGSVRTQGRSPEIAQLNGMGVGAFMSAMRSAAGR